MLTSRGLASQKPWQISEEKKLSMRWREQSHLDSPAESPLFNPMAPGLTHPEAPGCARSPGKNKLPKQAMQISAHSICGHQHAGPENAERYLILTGARQIERQLQPFCLLALADSTGHPASGQPASQSAIAMLFECLIPALMEEELPHEEGASLLQDAIHSANQRLYRQNQRDQTNMGCSITAALITNQQASFCHVGSNRGYVLSAQARIRQHTTAHTLGARLTAAGILTQDDLATRPACGRIYRQLGQGWWIPLDTLSQALASGDQVLVCSDGLWQALDDATIESTLSEYPHLDTAGARLMQRAQEQQSLDDITAILFRNCGTARGPRRPGIEQIRSNQPLLLPRGFILTH